MMSDMWTLITFFLIAPIAFAILGAVLAIQYNKDDENAQ